MIVAINFINSEYHIYSSTKLHSSEVTNFNRDIYYSVESDIDFLLQEIVDDTLYILVDRNILYKIEKIFKDIENIVVIDVNKEFLTSSEDIFKIYKIKDIKKRLKNYKKRDFLTIKNIENLIPFLQENINNLTYLGSNKQYIKNCINPYNIYREFDSIPFINPRSVNVITYDRDFNSDSDIFKNKFRYIVHMYEGLVGVKNIIFDNSILNRLNIFNSGDITYLSFSFLRYIYRTSSVEHIEFDNNIIVGTRMYIHPRDIFDVIGIRNYDILNYIYSIYYFIYIAKETYQDRLVTVDSNRAEFYTTERLFSKNFITIGE